MKPTAADSLESCKLLTIKDVKKIEPQEPKSFGFYFSWNEKLRMVHLSQVLFRCSFSVFELDIT